MYKKPGILRASFDYQDLSAIAILIDFYRQPDLFEWVELDSDDKAFASIDDIVACRTDGRFEITQVKFTVDPADPANQLDWDWLMKRTKNGRSLLQKWATTADRCAATGQLATAQLVTDRWPAGQFAKALKNQEIDFSKIEPAMAAKIAEQLGSLSNAKAFFERFRFNHSQPHIDDLQYELRARLVPSDTDEAGWFNLCREVKKWATLKQSPAPDGRVRHSHVRAVISRERPRPLDQDFDVPPGYQPPDTSFETAFCDRLTTTDGVTVLWGTPGRGKSTFLSHCFAMLKADKQICIRHHYFLRLSDRDTARFFFQDIETSLVRQLQEQLPELDLERVTLAEGLERASRRAAELGCQLIIFIDGLDHVWREGRSLEHMQQLFTEILPTRSNTHVVVGTQKVAAKHLPRRLLQYCPQNEWLPLPAMSPAAIRHWLEVQHKAGRLLLEPSKEPRADIQALAGAFETVTGGLPLHLIYAFEMLTRPGGPLTADAVLRLPPNPTGDIRSYYRALWTSISATARTILHGLASIDFALPPSGLYQCFVSQSGAAEAIEEIDHLLDHRETGTFPFHGSVFVFVRGEQDHLSVARSLQPTMLAWLEGPAPAYWKWAWTWITRSHFGDTAGLISGPDRTWALEALESGQPLDQIKHIFHEAEILAFKACDFARASELRSLRIRIDNAPEFQTNEFAGFVEATLRFGENDFRIVQLREALRKEAPATLISLLRALTPDAAAANAPAVLDELNRRARDSSLDDHRQQDFAAALAQVVPYHPRLEPERLKRFARANRRSDELIGIAINEALLAGLCETALSYAALHRGEQCDRGLFAVLCIDGADPRGLAEFRGHASRPQFHAIYAVRGWALPRRKLRVQIDQFLPPTRGVEDRALVTPRGYQFFFQVLSAALGGRATRVQILGLDQVADAWTRQAFISIAEAALMVAGRLDAGEPPPTLSAFYEAIDWPVQTDTSYDAQTLYNGLRLAVRNIAFDLQLLRRAADPKAFIEAADIPKNENPLWLDTLWIDLVAERRLPIHSPDCARGLLERLAAWLDGEITEFMERCDLSIQLSLFALDNELPDLASEFLARTARCLLGYGWRKDPAAFEALEALQTMATHDPDWAALQLLRLAPAYSAITEYTDGDETNHARSQYYDSVVDLLPERTASLYGELVRSDSWSYAEDLLSHVTRQLDPRSPHDCALLSTMIQPSELDDVRKHIAKRGKAGKKMLADLSRKIGYSRPRAPKDRGSNSSFSDKPPRSAPHPSKYPPSQLDTYRTKVASVGGYGGWKSRAIERWLRYWYRKGQGRAALAELRKFATGDHSSYELDKTYDLAFEASLAIEGKQAAFFWLVAAQRHRHGWQRWYTSSAEAEARLARAAKHYSDRWAEFIQESAAPVIVRPGERSSIVMGQSRLVEFLLKVGEHDRARALTALLVDVMISETEEQPLTVPEWAN